MRKLKNNTRKVDLMKEITITRQDGDAMELQIDEEIGIEWAIQAQFFYNYLEAYLLNVTEAGTGKIICVGVFFDLQEADGAAKVPSETRIVPYRPVAISTYLSALGFFDLELRLARFQKAGKFYSALNFINGEINGEEQNIGTRAGKTALPPFGEISK